MSLKKLAGLIFVLIITACLPQLVANSQREEIFSETPNAPIADFVSFLPLLFSFKEANITPPPDVTTTPVTVTPFTPEPTSSTTPPTPEPTSSTTPPTPDPTSSPSPQPTPISDAIVADHYVIDAFESIPDSALNAAIALDTLFMHQSTGNNIESLGFRCLAGLRNDPDTFPEECIQYAQNPYDPYDNRNWDWPEWPTPMADAIAKTDQWVSIVNSQQQYYQVLGMKFCYVDGWNQDFDYYRQAMEQLEQAYPDKIFIWTTSAMWSESNVGDNPVSDEKMKIFNQQLRDYTYANNKILYDLADIESHDPAGNLCQTDGFEALCDEYSDGYGGGGGGHPDIEGSIRLAKGYWWLMARIGGWDGN